MYQSWNQPAWFTSNTACSNQYLCPVLNFSIHRWPEMTSWPCWLVQEFRDLANLGKSTITGIRTYSWKVIRLFSWNYSQSLPLTSWQQTGSTLECCDGCDIMSHIIITQVGSGMAKKQLLLPKNENFLYQMAKGKKNRKGIH